MDSKKITPRAGINIAFFVDAKPTSGGGFQYCCRAIRALKKYQPDNVNYIFFAFYHDVAEAYKKEGIEVLCIRETLSMPKDKKHPSKKHLLSSIVKRMPLPKHSIEKILMKVFDIDLVYFFAPSMQVLDFKTLPYVMTVWDLCHRDYNEFPEIRKNDEFERREKLYTTGLKKAAAITVDAPLSKDNIIRRYGIDDKRIHVLPFLPAAEGKSVAVDIDIKKKYSIANDYIFYPAQFWAHKNHIYILKALKALKENHDIKIDAIFTGSDKGNLKDILQKAEELGIAEQIHYLGFVDNEEMPSLYKQSLSLVMPTYFGPTNIPPLEAFLYGCPVCYSDLEGLKDQVGDAAFLMDLQDPKSLAEHLITIQKDKKVVEKKKALGKKILSQWSEEDFSRVIINIIEDYRILRECWQ
ncbi:MAG: glycosyltransferase family 4 protein [Waddliaceae bacterium]|jgi:glycosyltransferase involved in cell wall biosynthesis|nr:glycosyltransferase family 4 protein [Waddliaceae bacterium]MBT3579011.1 glycosyltransferase family 4 protein [Waddliaceae bacterium]MBT4444542.1 glycosyltransferase family 4 protein [Waddliaceae bacterium]MBT6928585.1 glycosyltransferase family 4 protein [Waddliaceae bacterium]MBT7264262.1 glycosyltransferase family 4 protein [Waddliaceae bacterium]